MTKPKLNKSQINTRYQELLSGESITPQKRGIEFENIIGAVLENEKLEPRVSYRPKGEQVDGSFFWEGRTFLIEAKWVNNQLPASDIYAFKGKLDGKFHTTSGVFISMGGYSEDVEDALKFGKTLNIILFDKNDINLIFTGKVSFLEVLKFKLRQAGDTGSLLAPYQLKARAKKISKSKPTKILKFEDFKTTQFVNNVPLNPKITIDDLLVFVEGKSDVPIINNLIKPIKNYYSLSYKIEVLNGASNIRQLPSLINIYGDYNQTKAVIVVLDSDQNGKATDSIIKNIAEQLQTSSISVRPIFLFIDENLKSRLINELPIEELRTELIFERLEAFIRQIANDYFFSYDPEKDIPFDTLNKTMKLLEWNFKDGVIEGMENEAGQPYSINSLDELVDYLDEEIIQAMNGEMPLHWLKNQEFLNYSDEVREYLHSNYSEQLNKLGWDADL